MEQQVTTTKKVNTPKVLESGYVVKVNGEVRSEIKGSLKEARDIVRALTIDETVKTVEIVRRNVTETLINTFEPKPSVSLVQVDDLTLD